MGTLINKKSVFTFLEAEPGEAITHCFLQVK